MQQSAVFRDYTSLWRNFSKCMKWKHNIILLYVFFWVIPRRLEFYMPTFRNTLFHLHRLVGDEWLNVRIVGVARKHTTCRTRRKFEVRNNIICLCLSACIKFESTKQILNKFGIYIRHTEICSATIRTFRNFPTQQTIEHKNHSPIFQIRHLWERNILLGEIYEICNSSLNLSIWWSFKWAQGTT
jgi:hypothetical protein